MSVSHFVIASALCVASATAQFVGPGLSWTSSLGGGVRSFVPSCTSLTVTGTAGETVTITVWGDRQAPFGLFVALGAHQCQPIPGLGNGLMLDAPVVSVAFGVLSQVTPCLACPPGLEPLAFHVPATLPPGTTIAFQGATLAVGNPGFSVAITGNY